MLRQKQVVVLPCASLLGAAVLSLSLTARSLIHGSTGPRTGGPTRLAYSMAKVSNVRSTGFVEMEAMGANRHHL